MDPMIHQNPVAVYESALSPGKKFPCLQVFINSKTGEKDLFRKIFFDEGHRRTADRTAEGKNPAADKFAVLKKLWTQRKQHGAFYI